MNHDDTVDSLRYALLAMMRQQMSLKQAVISFLYLKDKPLDVKIHGRTASYNWYEDKGAQEFQRAMNVLEQHPIIYWIVRIL